MRLLVVGINHRTAPVEIRERLNFGPHEIVRANQLLKERACLQEGLILSTCNRVEIYALFNSPDEDDADKIKSFLSDFHGINSPDFASKLYIHEDEETVRHLFEVASGLDSMVIGEVEILGQVKRAYQDARESKTTGKVLNRLLEKALNTAKKVRTDTHIARGSLSMSSLAVNLARKILGDLSDKQVLIIGAGEIGEQTISSLKKNGIRNIMIANRTFEKARVLADRSGAEAVRFEDLQDSLREANILICSTGAPHAIIKKQQMIDLMPSRMQRPLFIIDLAVPRDVEPESNMIDNIYLYDMDDLQKIVEQNRTLRQNELTHCQTIIASSCQSFSKWLKSEETRCCVSV